MAFSSPPHTFSPELCSPESSNSPSGDEVRLASNNPKKPAGRKKFTETRHPVYRGIRRKNSGRWVCELREPTKQMRIWLGTFPTPEMAARAYDVAAIALRGKSACVNFADSFSRLHIPDSTDPKVIQKAAAAGAEAFRPPARERYAPSPLGPLGDEFTHIKETEECAFTNQETNNETGETASSFWSAFEDGFFDIGYGNPVVSDDFEIHDVGLWDY